MKTIDMPFVNRDWTGTPTEPQCEARHESGEQCQRADGHELAHVALLDYGRCRLEWSDG